MGGINIKPESSPDGKTGRNQKARPDHPTDLGKGLPQALSLEQRGSKSKRSQKKGRTQKRSEGQQNLKNSSRCHGENTETPLPPEKKYDASLRGGNPSKSRW